ncbi:MAG TPA: DMT family transporter [Candidatus Saccharimonadales bacterium]|nr:DMT family transporter [Candidatus Saccharimonadales bacterium]
MNIFKHVSKGLVFSLGLSIMFSLTIVLTRFLLKNGENPLNLTTWVGMATLLPWLFIFKKHAKAFTHLTKKHILLIIFIGIAGSLGIDYVESLALANTPAANFAFLYRTIVVFTIILAWIFFKEKITKAKIILTVFILFGSYLLITNGKGISLTTGDLYTLLMALTAAFISNILIKHTVAKMHPDLSGSSIAIVATITLFFTALFAHVLVIPQNIPFIILIALFSIASTLFRNRAYKNATASFVTMIVSITPLFVAILSYFFLHESLGLVETIGGLIIVGAIVVVEKFQI